ncbi:Alpha/Beta hydrolase protein [Xylariaceae sp. FL0255]|nr:Alpha/Beta hydrolase protein [Xylariaceae sp. FL0255]
MPQLQGFEALSSGTFASPTGSTISYSHTPLSSHKPGSPILLLLHGWPQTRYIWRYAIPPLVQGGYSLFVPDLPGYGESTMSSVAATELGAKTAHDRVSIGVAVLSAVAAIYGKGGGEELEVVLIGHDRGARLSQRLITPVASWSSELGVARASNIRILGAMLMDIVPFLEQWKAHANPRVSVGMWHWSFLPAPISVPMVKAFGGSKFCREIITQVAGAGRESLFAGDALEHYAAYYEVDEVIKGAAADYSAGAAEDVDAQAEDLKEGRKAQVPVVVLYSQRIADAHGDVDAVWRRWVSSDVKLECHLVGGGAGHYLPEEAPEVVNDHIANFLVSLGV